MSQSETPLTEERIREIHSNGLLHCDETLWRSLCDTALSAARLREQLDAIAKVAQADKDDLAKMRDGTKMTRAGLVEVIVYQQQELVEKQKYILQLEKARQQ